VAERPIVLPPVKGGIAMFKTWGSSSAFDPATIDILSAALDRAWRLAMAEGRPDLYDPVRARRILAKRIMEMAKHGERDRARLALGALCSLRQEEQIRASRERAGGSPSWAP
jgi:hypothetical protein